MSTEPVTVLDFLAEITVPGKVFERPGNEYWALVCLRRGLEFLYRQAQMCDELVKQQIDPTGSTTFAGFGNLPQLDVVPKPLLTCAFHWYAISACQYVRTVGAIASRLALWKTPTKPLDYVRKVIPEVLAFRDKVAAHFAWTTKNDKDNDAERLASIIPPLAFVEDSFHVGAGLLVVQRSGVESSSDTLTPWSICKIHEQLRDRYWRVEW